METEVLDEIENDGIYIHIKNNNFYKVIDTAKMKHPDNSKWIDCVIYKNVKDNNIYVRSLNSFITHFKLAM